MSSARDVFNVDYNNKILSSTLIDQELHNFNRKENRIHGMGIRVRSNPLTVTLHSFHKYKCCMISQNIY